MAAPDSTAEAVLFLEKLDHALLAQNTHKGYRADWRIFRRWCDSEGLAALPATPETLALYIAVRLTMPRKVSTVRRHVCAIGYMHKRAGLDSPVTAHVCELLRGAGEQNVSDLLIAAQTGHRDIATLRGYFRRTDVFRANACAMLGL